MVHSIPITFPASFKSLMNVFTQATTVPASSVSLDCR